MRARRRLGPLWAGLALAAGASACGSPLTRAESTFAEGRYPDAENLLVSLEPESRAWSDARRAEYALYRGLVRSALGDKEYAAAWLREARAIEAAHPGSLSHEDAQRLRIAADQVDPE